MFTHSGVFVSSESGSPTLQDIAIQLGRMPRFVGATKQNYPVLAHSLVVADIMTDLYATDPEAPKTGECIVYGCLHDAHECVTGDVPTPVKCDCIRGFHECVDSRLYESLGVPEPDELMKEYVKIADNLAFYAEAYIVGAPGLYDYIEEGRVHCRGSEDSSILPADFDVAVGLTRAMAASCSDPAATEGEDSVLVKEFIGTVQRGIRLMEIAAGVELIGDGTYDWMD